MLNDARHLKFSGLFFLISEVSLTLDFEIFRTSSQIRGLDVGIGHQQEMKEKQLLSHDWKRLWSLLVNRKFINRQPGEEMIAP